MGLEPQVGVAETQRLLDGQGCRRFRGRWWTRSGPVPTSRGAAAGPAGQLPSKPVTSECCDPGVTMMGLPAASSTGCHVFMFSITAWPPPMVQTHPALREGSPGSGLQGSLLALLLGPAPSRLEAAASGKFSAAPWWGEAWAVAGGGGCPTGMSKQGENFGAQGLGPQNQRMLERPCPPPPDSGPSRLHLLGTETSQGSPDSVSFC